MKKLRIAIDVDGTLISENYPFLGVLRNRAKYYINKWHDLGHMIIINTCRSGLAEADVIKFLNENDIYFDLINENDPKLIDFYGMDCRKISADIHIDDRNSEDCIDWDIEAKRVDRLSTENPLIIAIVGKSGSGKTTMAEHIEREFGIVMIRSHTDRDQRHINDNDHTFHTKEEFDEFKEEDMIASTSFGNKRYCCLKSDLKRRNSYVIDEHGLLMLDKSKYDVIAIRMYCPRRELKKRIGKERAARDKGKFSFFRPLFLWLSRYDYYVNTKRSKADSQRQMNKIIKKILKKRINE
jgi:guanylate kinase